MLFSTNNQLFTQQFQQQPRLPQQQNFQQSLFQQPAGFSNNSLNSSLLGLQGQQGFGFGQPSYGRPSFGNHFYGGYGGGLGGGFPQQSFFNFFQQIFRFFFDRFFPPVQNPPVDPPTDPPTDPPVDPPTDPPAVDPHFTPGSLALEDVPVDSNGNIDAEFLADMLTPENAVNTNMLDASEPSGFSRFFIQGMRMMGHDLYFDGQMNGDVYLTSLLNPEGSGNSPFVKDQESIDITKEWGRRDLADDGELNGSVWGSLIEQVWPTTDGVSIPGFANRLNFKSTTTNAADLFVDSPDLQTPEGLEQFLANHPGINLIDLQVLSLWGHDQREADLTMQQIADNAVNDPTSMDFGLTHASSEVLSFTEALIDNPNAERQIGTSVLNFLLSHLR